MLQVCIRCCSRFLPAFDLFPYQMEQRHRIRMRYGIGAASQFSDCSVSMCCSACALTQESQEIELDERRLISSGTADD